MWAWSRGKDGIQILALFLSIYGPRLHPKLPPVIKDLFNNNVFRFLIIALISYISSEDLTISLILSIAFLLFIGIIDNQQQYFNNNISIEVYTITSDKEKKENFDLVDINLLKDKLKSKNKIIVQDRNPDITWKFTLILDWFC